MAEFDDFVAGLERAGREVQAAARQAVDVFGEQVVGDASTLAPVETGALKASGTTLPARQAGATIVKTVGHNAEYAAAVHENLTAFHAQGQAKYLETAMQRNAPKLLPFVADAVRAAGGGE